MDGRKSKIQTLCGVKSVRETSGPANCEQSMNNFIQGKSEMRLNDNAVRISIYVDI